MDLKAGLWQQQTLKLAMTQELSQAIALLQFSSIELVDFLESKALENPLLQFESSKIDVYRQKKRGMGLKTSDKAWIEQISDQRFTLTDHIYPQIQDMTMSPHLRKVVTHFIDHLDDNGYFTGDLKELSDHFHLSLAEAESCLSILQQVEPAGIGARHLQECLLLQIRRQSPINHRAETIVSDYFKMFAEKKWKGLSKILSIELKEIQQVSDYILTLNPKPGAAFHYERAPYVIPDVMVVHDGEQFVVRLFDNILPKIQFNKEYFKNLTSYQDQKVTEFLHDKQQDYHWIIRSIEQRQRTIVNVTSKIVDKQQEFFKKGPDFLKPMTMKEIAEDLEIHESTVSRTVREKYVQTPFGTVELKTFFTNAIESVSNESISSNTVKTAMEKLFKAENKQKPFSDLEMVQLLKEQEGIDVSRRTIAKYREQLGIPSSSKRKRFD
ncbi:RNA polymerase factor sigma-54 [Bacillus sp. 1NLA3E]|uniref:RNA polymerase factor sigma-54 n=1 Tax=Bacillus sp. 1NLA3E TaxID=666686 RepID=UPI000247EFB0|nr:RNA polymerase factor sigma-54 [Bacillus sp. 1NLA3E]AGK55602.1 RNA polymerase factor sigma-54 [Bacillus sp. 1NLA3E]